VLAAGAAWGAAATVRANGVFAGLVFAYDALAWAVGALAGWETRTVCGLAGALGAALAAAAAAAAAAAWRGGVLGLEPLRRLVDVLGPAKLAAIPSLAALALAALALAVWLAKTRRVAFLAADAASPDKPSILSTLAAGAMVAAGFAYPQYLAYLEYCAGSSPPGAVWCTDMPPSIFSSIQARYWYV
jgi:Mannosyltransferase (PIG-V)